MEFKLGQKVSYRRISNKLDMTEHYLTPRSFVNIGDERKVPRRMSVILDKERTGYIVGKRRLVSVSTLTLEYESNPDKPDYVDIVKQEYETFYLVACNMRNYDYVLEKDLRG